MENGGGLVIRGRTVRWALLVERLPCRAHRVCEELRVCQGRQVHRGSQESVDRKASQGDKGLEATRAQSGLRGAREEREDLMVTRVNLEDKAPWVLKETEDPQANMGQMARKDLLE
jgi:hypothetical protein